MSISTRGTAWLTDPARTAALLDQLRDAEWPGDAKIAGWWVWGQCAWIGSGWCEKTNWHQIPSTSGLGQKPFLSSPGMGLQAEGCGADGEDLSPWRAGALDWIRVLSARLERVRIIHGDWSRTLNHHYGGADTAIFFDPPYRSFEHLYAAGADRPVADAVADWCREHGAEARIALCGHRGDYNLPGWDVVEWKRDRLTYGGGETTDEECVWFSPSCLPAEPAQRSLFGGAS